ncbi:MAG: isopentenyl-diphosphate Delta-isomerase [Bacteroidales bacterium]|nr:isopentenyl-diphosphate Delta-isomerase [Bacteroidales bacterium]
MEKIALVNEDDKIIGYESKALVHQQGLLHRAFSILVFNSDGRLLLQRRAVGKYHSGGLWTNTCCSHLVEGEEMISYAHNRLQFEMGFDCELKHCFSFHYTTNFPNGCTENEIDYVMIGKWDGTPLPCEDEVCDFRWVTMQDLLQEIENSPDDFTFWFKIILQHRAKFQECF